MKKIKYYLSLSLICFSFEISARSVLDVISENKNLTIFYSYLERTDLKRVLEKELPWNWTIFAPSNKAFRNASKNLKEEILEDEFYSKSILMDHLMTGHTTSLDVGEKISTQITVSNKPIQIYKSKRLYVKDMVVVDENLMGNNGVIHVIDCIMFVQPSSEDDRVSKELEEDFPITSCCMREKKEIESFKKSARNKF